MPSNRKTVSKVRRSRRGRGLPRIMWVAIAVCIIGAVLIFRDQSGDVPTGIGEYKTVVTAPETENPAPIENTPGSGDVDINEQTTDLTPEKPAEGSATQPAAKPEPQKAPSGTSKPKSEPVKPAATSPQPERIKPVDSGPYLVQTGSFGDSANADKEATRLQGLGFDARVKVGNTSDGTIIYRVRVGYFKSRTEAEAFIRQNRAVMPGAIPAHR